jgi:hypothetical protein
MTVVGQATVEVQPDATAFGPKTAAAVKKALAGINAKIDLTIEESGLRTKLSTAVRAASAGLEAQIGTNFDAAPIKGAVRRAVADAVSAATPDDKTQLDLFDIDPAKLAAEVVAAKELARAALSAGKQLTLDIDFSLDDKAARAAAAVEKALDGVGGKDFDVDFGNLAAKARAAAAAASQKVKFEVDFDDGERIGNAIGQAVQRSLSRQRIKAPPIESGGSGGKDADRVGAAAGGIFGRAVLRSAARVLAAGALAQLFTASAAGAVAIGAGLISATGAAGSLVATVAVLPGLLTAAAQAAASISFALGGVGGALKAFGVAQKAIGKQAAGGGGGGDGGAAARAAERAIRNATRGVEDAYREAAEAVEAATERIADAGRSLIRAQRDQLDAQQDLTRARVEAREEAEELRRSVERLSLTEAEARRRLAEARIKTALQEQRALQDLTGVSEETLRALERQAAVEDRATFNPREKAANDLRDAELDLQEATAKRVETERELNEFERTGVEGTERVIEARERLAEADERVADEERDLLKATRDLVRAQEDGARRIADAQEQLADAIASAAEGAGAAAGGAAGAIDAYEAALARLSPASRRFVEFLVGLEPLLRRVQATAAQGLFPGLESAITALLPLIDDLEPIIGATAKALADLAIEGANLLASPAFRGDLITIGQRNIDIINGLGRAAISGVSSLRHLTIAAGPLTQHLVDLTQHFALLAEGALATARANGSLEAFFGRVQTRIDRLIVTVGAFGTGLFRVFREATPAGDKLFDSLQRIAVRFELLTDRASRDGTLRKFFDSAIAPLEAVGRLLSDVAVGLVKLGTANFGSFVVFADQLRTELLPVLLDVLGKIDTDFLSAIVSLTTGLANLFGSVLTGNPTLTLFVDTLASLADGISTLLTDIPLLSPILQGLVTVFGALAVIGAVTALKQFASSVFGVEKALMTMTGSANAAELAKTRLGATAARVGTVLSRTFVAVGLVIAYRQALESLTFTMDDVVAATIKSEDPLRTFEEGLQRLANPTLFDRIVKGVKEISQFNFADPIQAVRAFQKAIEDGSDKAGESFRKLATSSPAHAQTVIDGMKSAGIATAAYEKVLGDVIQAKAKHGIAEADVQKKVDAATKSLQTNNEIMKAHTDRMREATSQALSLAGAETNTEEAMARLTEATNKGALSFASNTEAGRANRRMIDDVISGLQREITELGSSNNATGLSVERKRALLAHLDTLARSGYPDAEIAAYRLRAELERIENTYTATVDIDLINAQNKLASFARQLNAIQVQSGIDFDARLVPGVQREFGGRVLRNQAYIVGERRPELFIPDKDGVILPQVPDMAAPVATKLPGFDFSPSADPFDIEGISSALDDLERSLTDRLASQTLDDERRAAARSSAESEATTVEQTIVGPLVSIDNTFGPGAAVEDLLKAMDSVADQRIIELLMQVLKDHGAGAGTR